MARVKGLPDTAACFGLDGWGVDTELRAQTVEMLDAVRLQVAASAGAKLKQKRAMEIPRPESVRPKKTSSWVEFARGLAQKLGR